MIIVDVTGLERRCGVPGKDQAGCEVMEGEAGAIAPGSLDDGVLGAKPFVLRVRVR